MFIVYTVSCDNEVVVIEKLANGNEVRRTYKNSDSTGLKKEEGYKNDTLTWISLMLNDSISEYEGYYSNGELKSKGNFKNNMLIGEWSNFYPKEKTVIIETYTPEYWIDTIEYVNELTGEFEEGVITSTNGTLDGKRIVFKNGIKIKTEFYKNGYLIESDSID